MNIRHKLPLNNMHYYITTDILNITVDPLQRNILRKIEDIIYYNEFSSSTILMNRYLSSNHDPWEQCWKARVSKLIDYFNNLIDTNAVSIAKMIRLVNALQRYINSRDYDCHGRYSKTSYLGFSIVKSTESFKDFNKTLDLFSQKLSALSSKNADCKSSFFANLLDVISNSMTYLTKHPQSILILLAHSQILLAAARVDLPKPVAYFPFNGNALDATGNGNDAIVHGAVLTEGIFGEPNTAYHFDGTAWIEGPIRTLPDEERTVSLFFTLENCPNNSEKPCGGFTFGYGGKIECGSSFEMIINNPDKQGYNYEVQAHCNKLLAIYPDPQMKVSYDIWHHWAVTTTSDGQLFMYLDGKPILETSIYYTKTYTEGRRFAIGAGSWVDGTTIKPAGPFFIGKITNMSVYDVALKEDIIAKIASILDKKSSSIPNAPEVESDKTWYIKKGLVVAVSAALSLAISFYTKLGDRYRKFYNFIYNKYRKVNAIVPELPSENDRRDPNNNPLATASSALLRDSTSVVMSSMQQADLPRTYRSTDNSRSIELQVVTTHNSGATERDQTAHDPMSDFSPVHSATIHTEERRRLSR